MLIRSKLRNEASIVRGKGLSFLEFDSWQGAINWINNDAEARGERRDLKWGLSAIKRQWGWTWMLWQRSKGI